MDSFNIYALAYLADWCDHDRRFIADLHPLKDDETRRLCMQEAAVEYRIARNFKTIEGEMRFARALHTLKGYAKSVSDENVDVVVEEFAYEVGLPDKRRNLSAASKFLWFLYQSPVVIYDSLAVDSLHSLCGQNFLGKYKEYRAAWRDEFRKRESEVRAVCAELAPLKRFMMAGGIPGDEFETLIASPSFHERVFDYYLIRSKDSAS